jgi:hypothetical protein
MVKTKTSKQNGNVKSPHSSSQRAPHSLILHDERDVLEKHRDKGVDHQKRDGPENNSVKPPDIARQRALPILKGACKPKKDKQREDDRHKNQLPNKTISTGLKSIVRKETKGRSKSFQDTLTTVQSNTNFTTKANDTCLRRIDY